MEIYIILAVIGIVYVANRYRKAKQHRERMKQKIQEMRDKNIPVRKHYGSLFILIKRNNEQSRN